MATMSQQNAKTISSAFARFRQSTEDRFRMGMELLMDYAVQAALANHDSRHQSHLVMGDTYGWILFHDGVEVSRKVIGSGDGDVSSRLGSVNRPGVGWCGVLMSGFRPMGYFDVAYEFIPLRQTIADLKQNGLSSRFFRRVNE